ncbi:AraC family transcriptional regulator [Nitratifractor sp.]
MKKRTLEYHNRIANDALFYIYTHIDTEIRIEELAEELGVSRFHLQRIFRETFGSSLYRRVSTIRLEKAANLLLVNAGSTVSEIALQCGYSSQSSFIKAFRQRFGMTPGAWRREGYREYSRRLLGGNSFDETLRQKFESLEYQIVKCPEIRAYYIRHRGYDSGIVDAWQRLRLFSLSHDLEDAQPLALYHDNPAICPLEECAYVACLATDREVPDSRLPTFRIAGGIYARFDLQGDPGEEVALLHWIYHSWLPQRGFETTPKPSYALYHRNPFLGESLDLSYFVSLTL